MLTTSERELLVAMAEFLVYGRGRLDIIDAIACVKADRRCEFDGNILPCPHHNPPPHEVSDTGSDIPGGGAT